MEAMAAPVHDDSFVQLYHVGDNPAADIRGALNAGDPWRGILVRTGIFTGTADENARSPHPAHAVVPDVMHAVQHVLSNAV
ncbi:MAG: hypothetical protein EOO65_04775 [Methanosarcinales archaeon]|nr:MAG: hypothetical protein EOO65_04775 [Methanosarcinales archaeon]